MNHVQKPFAVYCYAFPEAWGWIQTRLGIHKPQFTWFLGEGKFRGLWACHGPGRVTGQGVSRTRACHGPGFGPGLALVCSRFLFWCFDCLLQLFTTSYYLLLPFTTFYHFLLPFIAFDYILPFLPFTTFYYLLLHFITFEYLFLHFTSFYYLPSNFTTLY